MFAVPAVFGAVHGPVERRGVEIVVLEFERRVVFEEKFDGFSVAVPGRPVKGGGVVLTARIDRQAGFDEKAEGGKIAFASGVRQRAWFVLFDLRDDIRMGGKEAFNGGFVVKPAIVDELNVGRAAVEEDFEDVFVAEFLRDLVRRNVAAKCPKIDCATGARIGHREGCGADAVTDGVWI